MSGMLTRLSAVVLTLGILLAFAGVARASGLARTQTLAVGPYIVDVTLSQDPPSVDTPFSLTVTPHDRSLRLQGQVTAAPGLGTDAVPLHFALTASGDASGTLQGTVRVPVRGAWNLVLNLSGPQGSGSGQVAVTVAAPGAIPFWLAWVIGSSPLLLIAFWIWRQRRYKRSLLAASERLRTPSPGASGSTSLP